MSETERQITCATVESQQAMELPDREALSLINANAAIPINAALSANVLSDSSVAYSSAQQTAPLNQGMLTQPPISGL
jgi:hypothetical protein